MHERRRGWTERPGAAVRMIETALEYARRGWGVFPIWPIRDGRCACGTPCGRDAGKHPIGRDVPNGFRGASADTDTIARWWSTCRDASIGIPTGEVSGIWVLDI